MCDAECYGEGADQVCLPTPLSCVPERVQNQAAPGAVGGGLIDPDPDQPRPLHRLPGVQGQPQGQSIQ
jgi:hypothetical protein